MLDATWNPPAWTAVGAAGNDQRTPELASLVQEIVGRSGWVSGNALVLVVAGTGVRTADSFDGNPGGAPLLDVVYLDTPDLEKPSTPQNLGSPAQTGTTIELAWDAATDNVGVTGYRVYGPNGTTDVTGTSHVETGLAPNTTYGFQVSALDAAGNESEPSPVLNVQTRVSTPVSLSVRVASGDDDAEERISSGSVKLTSSDLELCEDKARPQLVGLRFANLTIPQGATILSARVLFTVDEQDSAATSLEIRGEASDHAAPFSTATFDVSARPTTAAVATWNPPAWTAIGAAGDDQRTDDFAAVLQEIVDHPGWSAGNAIVLLISGSGSRVAESYDGSAPDAAELVVDYLP